MSPPRVDQSSSLATSTRRMPARPGFFHASFNTVKTNVSERYDWIPKKSTKRPNLSRYLEAYGLDLLRSSDFM